MSNLGLIVACLYTYCANGSVVTYSSSELARAVYSSHWYKYPLELQPFLTLMMGRAQKPFYFAGYQFGQCSLENFTAVNMNFQKFKNSNCLIRILLILANENVILDIDGITSCR